MSNVVMLMSFRLGEGVSEADFLAASDKVQGEYLCKCKGYISRKLFVSDGVWTDFLIWESMADAERAMGESEKNASVMEFLSLIGEPVQHIIVPIERSY